MKKIIAGIIAGIILHVWGMASWMILPWHNATMKSFADEDAIQTAVATAIDGPGLYHVPDWPADPKNEEAMKAFEARHAKGPVALIAVSNGGPAMPSSTIVKGLVNNILIGLLLAFLVGCIAPTCTRFTGKLFFVAVVALIAGLSSDVMSWNWMHYPAPYTAVMVVDRIIGFLLAGLVLAKMVSRQPENA